MQSFGHGSKRRVQLLDMNEIQEKKGLSRFGCSNNSQQTCHMQLSMFCVIRWWWHGHWIFKMLACDYRKKGLNPVVNQKLVLAISLRGLRHRLLELYVEKLVLKCWWKSIANSFKHLKTYSHLFVVNKNDKNV